MDDKTPEERLAAIEALMGERLRTGAKWRGRVDRKLDELLKNSKSYATTDLLKGAITTHVESCTKRANPGNSKMDILLKGYRGLGVVGAMLVINGMIVVVLMKVVGVF